MSDVLHAVFFVAIFGAIFAAVMLAEAYYWKLKGRLDIYNLKETVASVGGWCLDGRAGGLLLVYG